MGILPNRSKIHPLPPVGDDCLFFRSPLASIKNTKGSLNRENENGKNIKYNFFSFILRRRTRADRGTSTTFSAPAENRCSVLLMAMELCGLRHLSSHSIPTIPSSHPTSSIFSLKGMMTSMSRSSNRSSRRKTAANHPLEQPGGKMVVELVGAFNSLTQRMNVLSTSSSRLLFTTLKLSIPILQNLGLAPDGRPPLAKALSLALLLADLQMDAEVLSASILWHVLEANAISLKEVRSRVGPATAHLLHETWRLKTLPTRLDVLDDDDDAAASMLRRFCLTYYDIRALVLDLALKLDMMRNLDYLPRHQQLLVSLQVMRLHAPLAHAVGTHSLSLELEDLSFSYLFPYSYLYVDAWLHSHESGSRSIMDECALRLHHCLRDDPLLVEMVDDVSVKGRYKSRYSTMKKLLKDGRKPEQVNDVLGLRVILHPKEDMCEKACYRTQEIIRSLWKDIPDRTKDYIAKPKANGYQSLHMAVDVSDDNDARPMMEIQIRTVDMDRKAVGGAASHSLYKAGLTDAQEAKRLKTIMMAAAEFAALRLKDLPSAAKGIEIEGRDRVFGLLDKNGDGRISIEELMEVMEELGAPGKDAEEMMQLLDSNSDGSLNSDEFDSFQKQVELIRDLEQKDDSYKSKLKQKLEAAEENGLIQVYSKELGNRLAS